MPVFPVRPARRAAPGWTNYWGYDPLAFFAPHPGYSSRPDPPAAVDEFREMVRALHPAGIEVILDVVFNHTAEGNERGPTLCFKGLENESTTCSSTDRHATSTTPAAATRSTATTRSSAADLRLPAALGAEMHVDGFRFDLASILARDADGELLPQPAAGQEIAEDPMLADTKMIAEAWDAAGLYQVG